MDDAFGIGSAYRPGFGAVGRPELAKHSQSVIFFLLSKSALFLSLLS
jgi:hypothetical protein